MTTVTYPITPADAATVTADLHTLPAARIVSRDSVAHVFVTTLDDLNAWLEACGGYTTRDHAAGGLTTWMLRTHTGPRDDGSRTPIRVHTTVLDEEMVPDELTNALA
ncbi:hypothetical protein AB0933_32625 [Streptomyces venezuelae]|uniref:hypothetical protein n=1 Tax=Streptomyces venezuelae TaxID=54571 RepID=UPI003453AF82